MQKHSSLCLAIVIACIAPAAHALTAADVVRDAATKLKGQFGGTWAYTVDRDAIRVTSIVGRVPDIIHSQIEQKIPQIIEATKSLHGLTLSDFDLNVVVKRFDSALQIVVPQTIAGRRVENANLLITLDFATQKLEILRQTVPFAIPPQPTRGLGEARNRAWQRVCSEQGLPLQPPDEYGASRCAAPTSTDVTVLETSKDPQFLAAGGSVFVVYHFDVTIKKTTADGYLLIALNEYDISADASNPEFVVRKIDRIHRATSGIGRVFDPSPSFVRRCRAIRPETLKDDDRAYQFLPLPDLTAVDGNYVLSGPLVTIANIEIPDADTTKQTSITDGVPYFEYLRSDQHDFASVMAYHHIAALQQHTIDLGFEKRVQKPLRVDAIVEDDASPFPRIARVAQYVDERTGGYIKFGRFQPTADSLVSDAEDAQIITHEYGHALLLYDSDGRYGTEPEGAFAASEAKAVSEGFSDFWAMSAFLAKAKAARRNVRCFARWGNGGKGCYRKIGRLKKHDQIKPTTEDHDAGTVWSGALADILLDVFRGDRNKAEKVILKGHLTSARRGYVPTMSAGAEGILAADGDQHRQALCRVFKNHAISVPSCDPNGTPLLVLP